MGFWEDFFRRFSHLKRFVSYLLRPPRLMMLGVALSCLLIGGVAGFFLGPAVQANISEPGSSEDPLVSRSYVDEKLGEYLEELETELEELKTRTLELEEMLDSLR